MDMAYEMMESMEHALTLCILIDFPIHINVIWMGLTLYILRGSNYDVSKTNPWDCFDLSKMFRPYVMQQNAAFLSENLLIAKLLV